MSKRIKNNKLLRFASAIGAGLLVTFIAMFLTYLLPKHMVTYLEIPIQTQIHMPGPGNIPVQSSKLEQSDIQGKFIIITNGLFSSPAKVRLERLDDYNINKIYLGSKGNPFQIVSNPPSITRWYDHFVLDNLIINPGDYVSLYLATNKPTTHPYKCQDTSIFTGSITLDSGTILVYLPLIIIGMVLFLFLICMAPFMIYMFRANENEDKYDGKEEQAP